MNNKCVKTDHVRSMGWVSGSSLISVLIVGWLGAETTTYLVVWCAAAWGATAAWVRDPAARLPGLTVTVVRPVLLGGPVLTTAVFITPPIASELTLCGQGEARRLVKLLQLTDTEILKVLGVEQWKYGSIDQYELWLA